MWRQTLRLLKLEQPAGLGENRQWRVVTLRFRTTGENDIHGKWRTTSKREGGKSLEGSRVKYRYNLKNTKKMFKSLQIIELQQILFYLTLWKGWICIFLQLVILQQNMNLQHMILTRKVSCTLQEKYLIVPFWHLSKFEFL